MLSKKRIAILISYILASLWGILSLASIVTDPYTFSLGTTGIFYFTGALMGMILLMTTPLGIVFLVDTYLRNREKKDEVLKR